MNPDCCWSRLTAPGAAALQVYSLSGAETAAVLAKVLRVGPSESGSLQLGVLHGADGAIDQIMIAGPHRDGRVELALHGSVAVARALEGLLRSMGVQEKAAPRISLSGERERAAQAAVGTKTLELLYGPAFDELVACVLRLRHLATGAPCAAERTACVAQVDQLLLRAACGLALVNGPRVLLLGAPNAGKSSLWNALIGEDRAIISAERGTTRDMRSMALSVDGWPLILQDAAGLGADAIGLEHAAGEMTRAAAAHADLIVLLDAADAPVTAVIEALAEGRPTLRVRNKCDLGGVGGARTCNSLAVSAKTGEGLTQLRRLLLERSALAPLLLERPVAACPFTLRQQCLLRAVADTLRSLAAGPTQLLALVEELSP